MIQFVFLHIVINQQIKCVFLVDNYVFTSIESAKKFIIESSLESSEKDTSSPSSKGRDV